MNATPERHITDRQGWMSVLAKADPADLQDAWAELGEVPPYTLLRAPETGLVMVQGRAGGNGRRFNFGEMTMTRCAVALDDGTRGFGYVAGSDTVHAETAAVVDALLQDAARNAEVVSAVIEPLRRNYERRRRDRAAKTAATRVDFFTLVRGEDE